MKTCLPSYKKKNKVNTNFSVRGTFQPTDLGGCILWLLSDRGVTKDAENLVSTWSDLSGEDHDATQSTDARKPTWTDGARNGRNALTFDGTADFLTANGLAEHLVGDDTPFSFFMVFKNSREVGTRQFLWAHYLTDASAPEHSFNVGYDSTYIYTRTDLDGISDTSEVGTVDLNWHYLSMTYAADEKVNAWLDGTNIIDDDTLSVGTLGTGMDLFWIGAWPNGGEVANPDNHFMGIIAEVGFYNQTLSVYDRQRLETYLGSRYNL